MARGVQNRIMRAKNALISGEASVSPSAVSRRRSRSRLLVALTMEPVIAAAFAFFLGAQLRPVGISDNAAGPGAM